MTQPARKPEAQQSTPVQPRRPTRPDPTMRAMTVWGSVFALVALVICTGVSWWFAGPEAARDAAVTGGLVAAFVITGKIVDMRALSLADERGMIIVIGGYIARFTLLGAIGWVALAEDWVNPSGWMALAVIAVMFSWLGGIFFSYAHARIPVYDIAYESPRGEIDD